MIKERFFCTLLQLVPGIRLRREHNHRNPECNDSTHFRRDQINKTTPQKKEKDKPL